MIFLTWETISISKVKIHIHKLVNQSLLRSNMGTRKSNKKHKQVSITIHSIKTIMYSNIKNKEREIHNKAIGEIDFSNLKPLMYDPNNQNKEPYVTILLSKFQLDPTISET